MESKASKLTYTPVHELLALPEVAVHAPPPQGGLFRAAALVLPAALPCVGSYAAVSSGVREIG